MSTLKSLLNLQFKKHKTKKTKSNFMYNILIIAYSLYNLML